MSHVVFPPFGTSPTECCLSDTFYIATGTVWTRRLVVMPIAMFIAALENNIQRDGGICSCCVFVPVALLYNSCLGVLTLLYNSCLGVPTVRRERDQVAPP